MIDIGVNGTRGICELANELGVRRIVITSSLNVLIQPEAQRQPQRRGAPFAEDEHRLDFRPDYHPYGAEKCLSERAAVETFHGEVVAVQPGFIIGPLLHNDVRSSMQMMRMLLLKEAPFVFPMNACVPVDVRDLAAAHHGACFVPLPRSASHRCRFRRYNLAGPDNERSTPLSAVANILRELVPELGTPVTNMPLSLLKLFGFFDRRIGAYIIQELVMLGPGCDTRRVECEMGFRFRYQLRDTLRDVVLSFDRVGLLALPQSALRRLERDSAVVARGANAAAAVMVPVPQTVADSSPATVVGLYDVVATTSGCQGSTPMIAPILPTLLPCDLAALRSSAACATSGSTWLSPSSCAYAASHSPMTPPPQYGQYPPQQQHTARYQRRQPNQSESQIVDPIALLADESMQSQIIEENPPRGSSGFVECTPSTP
jgi:nucleoside-diphosphate-sugar epimerase